MILSEEPLLIPSSYLSTSTLFSTSFDAVGHTLFWNIFPLLTSMIHPLIFPSFFLTLFKHTFKEENHRLLCSWSHFLLFLHSSSCLISPSKKINYQFHAGYVSVPDLTPVQIKIWENNCYMNKMQKSSSSPNSHHDLSHHSEKGISLYYSGL